MQTGFIDSTSPLAGTAGASAASAASAAGKAGGAPGSSGSHGLGQDAFLQLLVTELQHQDPTQPQDPNAMITQMAQFSSLEQQTNTNTLLTGMQGQVSALFQGQSANLLGTQVQVTSDHLDLDQGSASVGLNLPTAAAKVTLTIQDAKGKTVATLNQGAMGAGSQVVPWDGKADKLSFFDVWDMTTAGLEFTWAQGQIADQSAGPPAVTLAWPDIKSIIRSNGPAGQFEH